MSLLCPHYAILISPEKIPRAAIRVSFVWKLCTQLTEVEVIRSSSLLVHRYRAEDKAPVALLGESAGDEFLTGTAEGFVRIIGNIKHDRMNTPHNTEPA